MISEVPRLFNAIFLQMAGKYREIAKPCHSLGRSGFIQVSFRFGTAESAQKPVFGTRP